MRVLILLVMFLAGSAAASDCARKWGYDYEMVTYCEQKQVEAAAKVIAFVTHYDIWPMRIVDKQLAGYPLTAAEGIYLHCQRTDGDWERQAYCLSRQVKAAASLGKL